MENKQNIPALLKPLNKQKKPNNPNPKPSLNADEIQVIIQNNKLMLSYLEMEAVMLKSDINFLWNHADPESPNAEFYSDGTYFQHLNSAKDALRANRKKYLTLAAIQSKLKKIL